MTLQFLFSAEAIADDIAISSQAVFAFLDGHKLLLAHMEKSWLHVWIDYDPPSGAKRMTNLT